MCGSFILGVDHQHDPTNLRRSQQTAATRGQQELPAQSVSLKSAIYGQAPEAEARHVMPRKSAFYDLRRPGIVNRRRTQTIKAENGFIAIADGEKSFRAASFVTLSGITAQEFVQRLITAIERFPVMFFADWLFMPSRHGYRRFGNARAAANNLAFGAGGFSSRSSTRKLSLAESCT